MDVATITMDRAQAFDLYKSYLRDRHYQTPIDAEIQSAYLALSKGKLIIQAMESCKRAGLNKQGLPKLVIGRADLSTITVAVERDGCCAMRNAEHMGSHSIQGPTNILFPRGSFAPASWQHGRTRIPPIPLHLRPRRALEAYHVLWEAEYEPVPPGDPYLLRRIGKSDMWLVVAQWDLTMVEKAALATRISVS